MPDPWSCAYKLNQLRLKLAQETHIVLGEEPQIFDFVFQVRDTFYPHTKSETTVFLRIDAAIFKHVGVDHTTAQYLYPTTSLAHCTSFALTDGTTDIHLRGWFGKWEVRWAEAHLGIVTEKLLHKIVQCLFQIGKRHMLVDV